MDRVNVALWILAATPMAWAVAIAWIWRDTEPEKAHSADCVCGVCLPGGLY